MPQLNQIQPEMAAKYVTASTRNLERQHRRPRPRARALFVLHYRRAVCGRVCERDVEATRDDLVKAADYGLTMFEERGAPRAHPRDVWEMRQVAGLLAAYGDAEQHARLERLAVESWYHPPRAEFEASALAYRLFNRFLVHRDVAATELSALDAQLGQANLHPVHTQAIAPVAQCLVAIERNDAADFEQAWATLTSAFATVAQYGEFARRMEGLLDPMALGILALGLRHGFSMSVTSPYASAELLAAPTVGAA